MHTKGIPLLICALALGVVFSRECCTIETPRLWSLNNYPIGCLGILQAQNRYGIIKLEELLSVPDRVVAPGEAFGICGVFVTNNCDCVGIFGEAPALYRWDWLAHKEVKPCHTSSNYRSMALAPNQQTFAAGLSNGAVDVHVVSTGKKIANLRLRNALGDESIYVVQFSGDSGLLGALSDIAIAAWQGNGQMHRKYSMELALGWPATSNETELVGFSQREESLQVRKLLDGTLAYKSPRLKWESVSSIAISPDSKWLAVAHRNRAGTVQYFSLPQFREKYRVRVVETEDRFDLSSIDKTEFQGISCLAYSPNNMSFASGGADRTVRLWNPENGRELSCFRGHLGRITCVAYSHDGNTLVSGDDHGLVLLWDTRLQILDAKLKRKELTIAEIQVHWNSLSDTNRTPNTLRNVWSMVAGGERTSAFLATAMRPIAGDEPTRIKALIADLDEFQSEVRNNASNELAKLGDLVEGELRERLNSQLGREARQRIEVLLKDMKHLPELQQLRWGLEVLRLIKSDESLRLLRSISEKHPGTWLAREARRVLSCNCAQPKPK